MEDKNIYKSYVDWEEKDYREMSYKRLKMLYSKLILFKESYWSSG